MMEHNMGAEGEQPDLPQDIAESFQEISDRLDHVNTEMGTPSMFVQDIRIQRGVRDAVESCRDELRNLRRELVERFSEGLRDGTI